jgi:hypothetical protein
MSADSLNREPATMPEDGCRLDIAGSRVNRSFVFGRSRSVQA